MLFSETRFEGAHPIEAYGENYFRVGGKKIRGGIFVFSSIVMPWQGFSDLLFLQKDVSTMEILFIGTGKHHQSIPQTLVNTLKKNEIVPEIFLTSVACRAYNVTISESRSAGALLFPILTN